LRFDGPGVLRKVTIWTRRLRNKSEYQREVTECFMIHNQEHQLARPLNINSFSAIVRINDRLIYFNDSFSLDQVRDNQKSASLSKTLL
jgi:hypothetical protein